MAQASGSGTSSFSIINTPPLTRPRRGSQKPPVYPRTFEASSSSQRSQATDSRSQLLEKIEEIRSKISGTTLTTATNRVYRNLQNHQQAYEKLVLHLWKSDQVLSRLRDDMWRCELSLMKSPEELSEDYMKMVDAELVELDEEIQYYYDVLKSVDMNRFLIESYYQHKDWFTLYRPTKLNKTWELEPFEYWSHSGTMLMDIEKRYGEVEAIIQLFSDEFTRIFQALRKSIFTEKDEFAKEMSDIRTSFEKMNTDADEVEASLANLPIADETAKCAQIINANTFYMKLIGQSLLWRVRINEIDAQREKLDQSHLRKPPTPPPVLSRPKAAPSAAIAIQRQRRISPTGRGSLTRGTRGGRTTSPRRSPSPTGGSMQFGMSMSGSGNRRQLQQYRELGTSTVYPRRGGFRTAPDVSQGSIPKYFFQRRASQRSPSPPPGSRGSRRGSLARSPSFP